MNQFDAIIFDMDGLLLDTERIALSTFLETCEHFGLGAQTDLFMRCIGTNESLGEQILKDGLPGKVDHLHFGRVWDNYFLLRDSNGPAPLKEGAVELLNHLSSLKIPTAVATSTRTTRARHKLQEAGLLNHFAAVVGGDQVQQSKPEPDIYLRAAEILNARPAACLALEDSENGVRAAARAGMTVIQIPDLVRPSIDLLTLGHIILSSLRDVAAFPFERTRSNPHALPNL